MGRRASASGPVLCSQGPSPILTSSGRACPCRYFRGSALLSGIFGSWFISEREAQPAIWWRWLHVMFVAVEGDEGRRREACKERAGVELGANRQAGRLFAYISRSALSRTAAHQLVLSRLTITT